MRKILLLHHESLDSELFLILQIAALLHNLKRGNVEIIEELKSKLSK